MKNRIILIVMFVFLLHPVWAENITRERVYLHTDKNTYLSGELLWMKFYLTDEAGKPSSLSKIGYVELVDESNAQKQVKLDIINGVAGSWMELPVSLPSGNYRLIAYTTNMRNEGESVFFNKTIGIINTFKTDALVGSSTVSADSASVDMGAFQQSKGNISVETDKQSYSTRAKSEIKIKGLPGNVHSLSISVAGRDFVQYNENIIKWNDGLKEYVDIPLRTDFLPEYEGHIINGKIIDVSTGGQLPEQEQTYSMLGFVGDQVRAFGGLNNGSDVRFFTKRITGMRELAITTTSLSNNKYMVNIETPFAPHAGKKMPVLELNPEWEKQLLHRSVGMQVQYAYYLDSMSRVDTTYSYFQWKPDRSYILDEYTRFTTMEEIVIEFIPSLRFRHFDKKSFLTVLLNGSNTFSSGNSLVFLDGIPIMDYDIILKYNPLLVYKIDVYKEKFVFGNKRYEGLVFLTTYNHDYPALVTDGSTHLFDYEGAQLHRYFYSPSYTEKSDAESKIPDYRHTLLWMPDVETGGLPALSVPFSTSDITGDFQVTVEGLTKDGKAFRGTSFFKVENP